MDGQRKRQCKEFLLLKQKQLDGKVVKQILFRNHCNRAKDTSVENWAQFQIHEKWGFKTKEQGGIRVRKITKKKHKVDEGYWLTDLTGFFLKVGQSHQISPRECWG